MKKAILVQDFPKVSQTFINRLAGQLEAQIVTSYFSEEDAKFYKEDFAKVIVLKTPSAKGAFIPKIIKKLTGRMTFEWNKRTHREFARVLRETETKVVLAPFGPNGINAYPACRQTGVKLFIYFLGYDASSLLRNERYVREIVKTCNAADGVIVLYEGMQDGLVKEGMDADKVTIIPLGVSVSKFPFTERKEDKEFRFLAVGRMTEKKSPLTTLRAFLRVADQNPAVRLTMIGDGVLYEQVKKEAEVSPHRDKIHLPGFLSQEEMRPFFTSAHVFLQHSVTSSTGDKEGWPVSIGEACAYGLPVVSTIHSGIPDQVKHGYNGFLTEENDEAAMTEYMLRLSNNFFEVKQMGINSRAYIAKNGNSDILSEQMTNLLEGKTPSKQA